jgi:DNA-directed RNA polymerase subunit RPC12/RpoP
MASITKDHNETCTQCGSRLIHLEWEERLDSHQIQQLWRCLECKNEFITLNVSEEDGAPGAQLTEPFFTNLVVE